MHVSTCTTVIPLNNCNSEFVFVILSVLSLELAMFMAMLAGFCWVKRQCKQSKGEGQAEEKSRKKEAME